MEVKVTRGCPQGGVLSPLLWSLVVDDLLVKLNSRGYYAQAYADDSNIYSWKISWDHFRDHE
jgi:RNA-directed DNA polymerase